MKRNIVHIIYPCEKVISFIHESDNAVDSILESVFAMFNHGSGVESEMFLNSKCRSLSVNDIVAVNGKYHLCESFGWKEVTAEFVNDLEEEVENNPLTLAHGPWFGLSEVMFNRKSNNKLELV
jgi:uncharacterized membrane protein